MITINKNKLAKLIKEDIYKTLNERRQALQESKALQESAEERKLKQFIHECVVEAIEEKNDMDDPKKDRRDAKERTLKSSHKQFKRREAAERREDFDGGNGKGKK